MCALPNVKSLETIALSKNSTYRRENIHQVKNKVLEKKGRQDEQSAEKSRQERLRYLSRQGHKLPFIAESKIGADHLAGNIENYIGMAQVPIGLAGPLLLKNGNEPKEYWVPMATTEGALVASYNRGMKACHLASGITSICLKESVQRSPLFKFQSINEVCEFIKWINASISALKEVVKTTSRYAQLEGVKTNVEGNSVILILEFTTGDAAGQNMVTICTDQICKFILSTFHISPTEWYVESNYSGDKKATARSFINVRGKKVSAEIVIPEDIVKSVLKTSAQRMVDYWLSSTMSVIQSGAIGAQGHVANGLTALFIACGQDVACISESAVGITRMEVVNENDLYASVTLPSLIVGTVGGGTALPTQKESLQLLDCYGPGKSREFAEVCCATALAGEISIAAALSANHFTNAHKTLGRKQHGNQPE